MNILLSSQYNSAFERIYCEPNGLGYKLNIHKTFIWRLGHATNAKWGSCIMWAAIMKWYFYNELNGLTQNYEE